MAGISYFFSADSVGPSLARQIKTIRNSDVISDFFLETKVSIRLPVCMLVLNVSKANFT